MSVRITLVPESGRIVVKIDGWLSQLDADEVSSLIRTLSGPLALDLTELRTLDREVVPRIRKMMMETGVVLAAASPYVAMLLELPLGPMQPTSEQDMPQKNDVPQNELGGMSDGRASDQTQTGRE